MLRKIADGKLQVNQVLLKHIRSRKLIYCCTQKTPLDR